jgi:hypothetical protein
MQQTGERIGMAEFYVCLNCHPEFIAQVESYREINNKLNERFITQQTKAKGGE